MRLLLKELRPSHGPPVEDIYILIHHLLVGVEIATSLKTVGVNPAGTNPHSSPPVKVYT